MPSCSHLRQARSNGDSAGFGAAATGAGAAGAAARSSGSRASRRRLRRWRRRGARCGHRERQRRRRGRREAGLLGPVLAHDVVAGTLAAAFGERRQDFVRRLAAVERRDERLNDRDGAVVGPHVAPHLEVVRLGDVPLALLGGLVFVQTDVGAQPHLGERVAELQIGRRRVDGVAAEDQQEVDGAGVHLADELAQRRELIARTRFRRLRVGHRLRRRCRARR